MLDKNCLSYWFPILERAGLPVPKTIIIEMDGDAHEQVFAFLDGNGGKSGAAWSFADKVADAAASLGFPAFLRTGQTSAKHSWNRTCHLPDRESTLSHIVAIAEFSECCDMIGLPWHVWAVREMLETRPLTTLPRYGNFPLVPEVRCFVAGGKILCWHPYWPQEAIRRGGVEDLAALEAIAYAAHQFDESEFMPLAERVAAAFADDLPFSVDLLPTIDPESAHDRWYVTDMAVASRSFHWPDCPAERNLR